MAIFLDEIDRDQYLEWEAFFALEPQGWHAINRAQARISTMIALTRGKKRVRERDLIIENKPPSSERNEALRLKAFEIRQKIQQKKAEKRKRGKRNQ